MKYFITLIAVSSFAAASQANLVLDGGFESPGAGGGQLVKAGGTSIGSWTVVGVNVLYISTQFNLGGFNGMNNFPAQEGDNAIDLTGDFNAGPTNGVQQSFTSTAGQQYQMSFWVGVAQSSTGNPGFSTPATVDLSINGNSRTSFTNSNTGTSGGVNWQKFETIFTATGNSTLLSFLNGTPTNCNYAGLDNIEVVPVPVPEPASLVVLGVGLLFAVRKRAA